MKMVCYQFLFMFGILRCVWSFFSTSNDIVIENSSQYNQQFCVCVPYWQCKEDYSGLVGGSIDVVDVRKR